MKSFVFAWNGLRFAITSQINMRIHTVFAFYVVLAGLVTRISHGEWLAVLICIGSVISAECLNTAIERLCDTVHPEKSAGIRQAKDVSAAAVLVLAAASAVVGSIVFFNHQKFSATINFAQLHPLWAGVIILSLIPSVLYVFKRRKR